MPFRLIILFFGAFLLLGQSFGQSDSLAQKPTTKKTRIRIIYADSLVAIQKKGDTLNKLQGNVQLKQDSTLMYCDSAYIDPSTNSLTAFNRIRIVGDSINLTGDTLYYDGNTRLARLRGNIRMEDPDLTLETNFLNYSMEKDVGVYYGGGVINSKKDENTLTSETGYYYPNDNLLFFKDSVTLENKSYIIESDTLKYNTETEITYFFGPTTITSDSNMIYCENGWYDTKNDLSQFRKNAYIETQEQQLKGDSLFYDRGAGIGMVFGNVSLLDTIQGVLIRGDEATHWEGDSVSLVTGHAEMVQLADDDSLFVHGDTLWASYDSTGENRMIQAYYHVKFYRQDLQGKCDSMSYSTGDSTFYLFGDPVLWSDENQLTADSMRIVQDTGGVKCMYMDWHSFIISKDDSNQYNQIKGKKMIGFFKKNRLHRVDVMGNGQTIYYAREDEDEMIGVNKAVCSDMRILIDSNRIEDIYFLNMPDAKLTPMHLANPKELILKDFKWLEYARPKSPSDIFTWEDAPAISEESAGDYEEDETSEEEADPPPKEPGPTEKGDRKPRREKPVRE